VLCLVLSSCVERPCDCVFGGCYEKVIRQMDPKCNPLLTSTPPEFSVLKSQLNDKDRLIQQLEVVIMACE